jgi:hypothetical protein
MEESGFITLRDAAPATAMPASSPSDIGGMSGTSILPRRWMQRRAAMSVFSLIGTLHNLD